jgi:hypothetical protein
LIIEYHHRAQQQRITNYKMSVMSNGNIDLSVAEAAYGKHCDLYRDVLQVHPKASAQKIQDAYFTRRKHLFQVLSHLEQSTEPRTKQSELKRRRAERKMDAVVSAVRILGDAELRVQYNEVRKRRPPQPQPAMNNNNHSSSDTTNKKRRAKQQSSSSSKPHHHQQTSSPELPSLHDTSNSSTNITDEYSTSHEISDDEEEEANGRGGRDKVTTNHTAPTTPTAAPAAPLKSALLLSTRSKTRVAFAGPNNNKNKDQIPPPQQPSSSKRRPVAAAAAGRKPPSSTRAASTAKSAVVADETESNGSASLLMLSDTEDDEEEDGEEGTTLCSATVYDDLDDDVVSSRGDRLLPDVPRPPEGLLDRVRMEFLGALDDTARSFEQVFNAFTLQEEDIDAVVRRIDKAKLQIIQGHTTTAPAAGTAGAGNSSSNNSHNNDKPRVRRR